MNIPTPTEVIRDRQANPKKAEALIAKHGIIDLLEQYSGQPITVDFKDLKGMLKNHMFSRINLSTLNELLNPYGWYLEAYQLKSNDGEGYCKAFLDIRTKPTHPVVKLFNTIFRGYIYS